ncbi:cytoplasmic protein [Chelativorans sp.]|uniref:cytoplasmic protein n=1 Tax=Chelativorans sp. TaxID=2203393 RepID=UPI002811C3CE|nr:cytoplasmic protein [Chelativorans sp.]
MPTAAPAPLPRLRLIAPALVLAALVGFAVDAQALSDKLPQHVPGQGTEAAPGEETGETPLPDAPDPSVSEDIEETDETRPDTRPGQPLPEVIYDVSRLPEPVQRMRRLIIEACRSGDIERLRPLIGTGEEATQLTLGDPPQDPIQLLREISGDEKGQEILAILLEVMEAGFVRLNAGTEQEHYVWPYFFAIPLEELTDPQRVELFTIVTAGDYEEMKNFGAYIFYRSAITPEGQWLFFVAGD